MEQGKTGITSALLRQHLRTSSTIFAAKTKPKNHKQTHVSFTSSSTSLASPSPHPLSTSSHPPHPSHTTVSRVSACVLASTNGVSAIPHIDTQKTPPSSHLIQHPHSSTTSPTSALPPALRHFTSHHLCPHTPTSVLPLSSLLFFLVCVSHTLST